MAENLAQDMSDLMHDFDVVSRIDHGADPEEHQAEGRRDVLAGQELSPARGQEEGQDRNFDLPGW